MSPIKINKTVKFLLGIIVSIGIFSCSTEIPQSNFNYNWYFTKSLDSLNFEKVNVNNIDTQIWEKVDIPHSANIEPLVIEGKQWQGNCYYLKTFKVPNTLKNKHVALHFEGAMHTAKLYLNGKHIFTNQGGYLPFYVDISNEILLGKQNQLIIELNNEDNPLVPPGKNIDVLDFNIFSGIYRNVHFIVKNQTYISNPIAADRKAAGGILVRYSNVTEESANVLVNVDIDNQGKKTTSVNTVIELIDAEGKVVGSNNATATEIQPSKNAVFSHSLNISKPNLWSPDHPYLYQLVVTAFNDQGEIDQEKIKIGIRTFSFSANEGFVLNGQPLKIRGTNRHQEYPYIGYAISDNANYRDAYKIKKAGFNFVRLSHYPHSKSFMHACDELGLMVMDAIPGWQFFGNETFQKNSLNDVRNMMRRDRNHACVILWEASLNESGMSKEYMKKAHNIVHEELPGSDVYTCGWRYEVYDVFIPARQHAKPPQYWNNYDKDKPLLIAEYGDWEYYAQNAGFNQTAFSDLSEEERNSRQLRAYGQKRLAQQALNYQEAHNSNLQGPAVGDANWLMFDYNRGYAPDIEASGISDIFRLPKFAFYFYQSQAGPNIDTNALFDQPMVFIANYWNDPDFNDVKVYSNCDEVELFLNGKSLGKQKPDNDKYSTHLLHPPFTFNNVPYKAGTLLAKAYYIGKIVAEHSVSTPLEAAKIELWADVSGKQISKIENDLIFVYAKVTDSNGNILPVNDRDISIQIEGAGKSVGADTILTEAGIATFVVKTFRKGNTIKITCSNPDLEAGSLALNF